MPEPEDRTLTAGERARFTVFRDGGRAPVSWCIRDLRGREVLDGVLGPAGFVHDGSAPLDVPALPVGVYRLEIASGAARADVAFAVAPAPTTPPDPFFGNHVVPIPQTVATARKLGIGSLRAHDMSSFTLWYRVEPEPGSFVWQDSQVAAYAEGGAFAWLGTLQKTPGWAARCPDDTPMEPARERYVFPPDSEEHWRRYVRRVVRRYPRIEAWEVWNEPYHTGFWKGTPEQYVELLRAAAEAVRTARAGALVVGGCVNAANSANRTWFQRILAAGALRHMDVLSFHRYFSPDRPDDLERYRDEIRWLREEMRRAGGPVRPLWNSEWGVNSAAFPTERVDGVSGRHAVWPAPDPRLAAGQLLKVVAVSRGEGLGRIFYYFTAPRGHASEVYNIMDMVGVGGLPKPLGIAYAAASQLLRDVRTARRLDLPSPWTGYSFEAARDSLPVAVIWSLDGTPVPFPALTAAGCIVHDMFGNPPAGRVQDFRGEPMLVSAGNPAESLPGLLSPGSRP